jgi:arginine/lysine/ornithine decarboxylase
MMEPPGGTALVEESIVEALDFRRAMRKVETSSATTTGGSRSGALKPWPRKAWARPRTGSSAARTHRPRPAQEERQGVRQLARLWRSGRRLQHAGPDQVHHRHAGLDLDGDFADTGIPASIVTKYLAEHGVVVEKTGLYFFIMFTIGITKGRWNTMLTALQQFKDDYDRNQPLARILPEFCQQHRRYERMGLRDLCQHVHELYAPSTTSRA